MFSVEQIKSLNELELEIYEYVIKNPDKVKYMRIRELALEVHVSTSTILRFCQKMGCGGYSEFKLKMKEYAGKKQQGRIVDDITEVADFLKKTASAEFEQRLELLTDVILGAKNIFFIGSGMSGIVAKYGARYFSSMGKFSLYIDEPHYPTEIHFLENSLALVFSVSGESHDTIRHTTRFKERNCQILSITNTENCTVAKIADYNIAYYVSYMRLGDYDVTTQIPAMSIIERFGRKIYRRTAGHSETI